MSSPALERTAIDGLVVLTLPTPSDSRGWFKENWQRAKMTALGLPDFGPVQHNVAHNHAVGTTRGIHAEPWEKLVSLASGRVFGAWVDLRQGPGFGTVVTRELGVGEAVFVPRGVGNSYQTLTEGVVYSYLVNAHWSPDPPGGYTHVSLFDDALGIRWPIGLGESVISDADRAHPPLSAVTPVVRPRPLVVGASGQLGRALIGQRSDAIAVDHDVLDITDADAVAAFDYSCTSAIINAAAHTDVDGAETPDGRRAAWAVNATAVGHLARAARERRIPLVQVSTDYVFDGRIPVHEVDEPPSPLGVYGQSKAAAEVVARTLDLHHVVRTSWLIGAGRNFVATMARLAEGGASPEVVADQSGRLTFATDLAAGIWHLLDTGAPSGTWHVSNSGPVMTWADVAREVFRLRGRDPDDVRPCTTDDWVRQRVAASAAAGPSSASASTSPTPTGPGPTLPAPRPRHSTLDLSRIEGTGFLPPAALPRLEEYLRTH